MRFTISISMLLGLAAVACGGSVGDANGGRQSGIGACADCERQPSGETPAPSEETPPGETPAEDAGAAPIDPSLENGPHPTPEPNPPPGSDGIALRHADFPPPSSGSGTGSSGGGGVPIDPETLYVTFGSARSTCEEPFAATACGEWKVAFNLPPSLQVPGVLSLDDPRLNAYSSAAGEDRGGGDCSWGGGSFWQGTVEIVSIDETKLEIRLADTQTFDFDANGTHTVLRCP